MTISFGQRIVSSKSLKGSSINEVNLEGREKVKKMVIWGYAQRRGDFGRNGGQKIGNFG